MTWNEFRSQHKGTPQQEISLLWKKYKEGNEEVETAEETLEDLCEEFEKIIRNLERFGNTYPQEKHKKMVSRLFEIGDATHHGYPFPPKVDTLPLLLL